MKINDLPFLSLLRDSRRVRVILFALCAAFLLFVVVQRGRNKIIGGDHGATQRFNGKEYPLLLQPFSDAGLPDLETLTFKKGIILRFEPAGEIYFHVDKSTAKELGTGTDNPDGITLEVYADGVKIASKTANPYADMGEATAEDGETLREELKFVIPSGTKELKLRADANGNTAWDNVWLDTVLVTRRNLKTKLVLFAIALFMVYLLKIEWDLVPMVDEELTEDLERKDEAAAETNG